MVRVIRLAKGDVYCAKLYYEVEHKWELHMKFVVIVEKSRVLNSPTVAVLTLTTQKLDKRYPSDIFISPEECKNEKGAKILSNQPLTIRKDQLIRYEYSLSKETMDYVDLAMVRLMGL